MHTLNCTAIPTPRILVSLVENFQQADGSVRIPEVLQKYMGGKETINKKEKVENKSIQQSNLSNEQEKAGIEKEEIQPIIKVEEKIKENFSVNNIEINNQ